MKYDQPQLQDRLAAEYVLGTLRGGARRRFEALLAERADLAAAVREWEARLLPLAAALPPQVVAPRVWQRIEQRLFSGRGEADSNGWLATVWRSLGFWRTVAAGSAILAVLLGYTAFQLQSPPGASRVALLQDATGQPAMFLQVGSASAGASTVEVSLTPFQRPADLPAHSRELWAIAPGAPPRSLGLLPPAITGRFRVPAALVIAGDVTLAVSVEPPGGSPTGAPTGPVILQGKLRSY
jgi:anti-sigma-K factor RskA